MRALIIGYGSIGKRHEEVLLAIGRFTAIDLVTKQNIHNRLTYEKLDDVDLNQYDYFLVTSETDKHFEQLSYIESNVAGKIIFCEKPLFANKQNLQISNNTVKVGYVLRFHPLIQLLSGYAKKEHFFSVNVLCGSYLPNWRINSDYRKSYSAHKKMGGGVLLDLSHEIDYIQSLFGPVLEVKSYQLTVSDLEIDSDDLTIFIGKTKQKIIVNVSLDYFSKISFRKVVAHSVDASYELDLVANKLLRKAKNGLCLTHLVDSLERNYLFEAMHRSILNRQSEACTYSEALTVMNTIESIQEQNQ